MSYRLKLTEPLGEGLRRVALDQLDMVESRLRAEPDKVGAVHDARRCLKRLRALLRLIRPSLDEKTYRKETQRLAQVGRMLAGERDREVMLQTLQRLESAHGLLPDDTGRKIAELIAQAPPAQRAPPPRALQAPEPASTAECAGEPTGSTSPEAQSRRQALAKLAGSRKFFSGSAMDGVSMSDVLAGLDKVYGKARRGQRDCYRKPSDEAFHAWRKSVQQHWRHVALLSRAWPDALSARSSEAKQLSQILGEDHDLAVLIAFVSQHRARLPDGTVELLEAQARATQARLRQLAKLHGERLLFERPEELTARITAYWEAACHLAEVTLGSPPNDQASLTAPEQAAPSATVASKADVKTAVSMATLQRRSPRRKATA